VNLVALFFSVITPLAGRTDSKFRSQYPIEVVYVFHTSLLAAKDARIVPSHTLDDSIGSVHHCSQKWKDTRFLWIEVYTKERKLILGSRMDSELSVKDITATSGTVRGLTLNQLLVSCAFKSRVRM
jgi:hypothetical protein